MRRVTRLYSLTCAALVVALIVAFSSLFIEKKSLLISTEKRVDSAHRVKNSVAASKIEGRGIVGSSLPKPHLEAIRTNNSENFLGNEVDRRFESLAEYDAIRVARLQASVERRYAVLLRRLELDDSRKKQLIELLLNRDLALDDALQLFNSNKRNSNTAEVPMFTLLIAKIKEETDGKLRQFFTDMEYELFASFGRSEPFRQYLAELVDRLAYTESPLTRDQIEILVNINAATISSSLRDPAAPFSDDSVTQMNAVLSAPQIAILEFINAQRKQKELYKTIMKGESKR